MERVVLAYAGGFDAAAAIAALKSQTGAEVVVVTMDLGQGHVLEELRDRALAGGAARAHVLDLRETFAANYVLPSLKADATTRDGAPMAAALGRALVADKLVEMAAIEQADAVAYGPAAAGGQVAALDTAIRAVNPTLRIATFPGVASDDGPGGRLAANLWGRTMARTSDTGANGEVPERAFTLTKAPAAASAEAASIEIGFERGVPASLNAVPMPFVELIATVSHLAGAHGIGRIETADAVVEAPAAFVLHAAHKELQTRRAPRDGDRVSRQYADIIASDRWSTPARAALDKAVEQTQERVNGSITLKLFHGACQIV